MLMTFLSLVVTITLVTLFLPQFNEITGKHLILHLDTNLVFAILAITIITGLIAGSYPALYLSGFKPAMILKGKLEYFCWRVGCTKRTGDISIHFVRYPDCIGFNSVQTNKIGANQKPGL